MFLNFLEFAFDWHNICMAYNRIINKEQYV